MYFSARLFKLSRNLLKVVTIDFCKATKLRLYHVHLFKFFSSQLKDQLDTPYNTLLLHLIKQDLSLNISSYQNDTDAVRNKKEVYIVFCRTEFDTSLSTEVFPQQNSSKSQGYFSNPEIFRNQLALLFSSLKFDDDDDIPSVKNDTLPVNCWHTDYLSFHTARHPRQKLFRMMTKSFHFSIKYHF